ncbi:F0F1 ATP synthase subunit gamma [Limosilactobacillus secaliphilus]|uniref:ATP synthase gamma chain n=1 Tax=Limosilactobacillus secaliphilus TaxID=396268 RepID=A0A0R2IB86_9LACO|nr:F0F1 ATP synthase subunit gamma [Limosilactobacillus secaliphilus]KRN59447.1 ATP synthase F1, gamma subunit [Limosilactobacillus secaliphilus]
MPASLAAVKRKLESTRSTRQITTAMQMVSTAKLNQVQHHTKTYQAYESQVRAILASLVKSHIAQLREQDEDSKIDERISSLFAQREVKKVGVLVITSDRGLVGSYNSNVIKATMDMMAKHHLNADNTVFLTIGKNGSEFFKKRGMNVVYEYTGISDVPSYTEVRGIVRKAVKLYRDGVYDQLYVSYSHYVNRIISHEKSELFLPISPNSLEEETSEKVTSEIESEYELEPDLTKMISVLVPQYANSLVYGAILDAKTSEHASSANAMRSASDNASDIISTLQLQYNRARQAAITTEITEITGGMTAEDN